MQWCGIVEIHFITKSHGCIFCRSVLRDTGEKSCNPHLETAFQPLKDKTRGTQQVSYTVQFILWSYTNFMYFSTKKKKVYAQLLGLILIVKIQQAVQKCLLSKHKTLNLISPHIKVGHSYLNQKDIKHYIITLIIRNYIQMQKWL